MDVGRLNQINKLNLKNPSNKVQTKRTDKSNSMDTSIFTARQAGSVQKTNSASGVAQTTSASQQLRNSAESGNKHREISYANVDFDNLTEMSRIDLDNLKTQLEEDIDNPNIDRGTQDSLRAKRRKVQNAIQNMNSGNFEPVENKDEKSDGAAKSNSSSGSSPKNIMENSKNSVGDTGLAGGIGLAASLMATAKTTQAGDKTNKATAEMESENKRMQGQQAENKKKNEAFKEQLEKIEKQQKKDIKLQKAEEAKVAEQQAKVEETSSQVESLSQVSIGEVKTEDEAREKETAITTQITEKSQVLQSKNTQMASSQTKINSTINKQKKNVNATKSLRMRQVNTNKRYATSINVAASRVATANTTANTTQKTTQIANSIGTASSALGKSVATVGRALQSNPYTKAAGEAMEKYGNITDKAGQATQAVSGVVSTFAAKTSASAGVTASSTMGAHSTNVRLQHLSRHTGTVAKGMTKQVTTSNKSAQQVKATTQRTMAQADQMVDNMRNELNAKVDESITELQMKQPGPANNKQNINGKDKDTQNKQQQPNAAAPNNQNITNPLGKEAPKTTESQQQQTPLKNDDDPFNKKKFVQR